MANIETHAILSTRHRTKTYKALKISNTDPPNKRV